jgi:HK97 family phage prohead protease
MNRAYSVFEIKAFDEAARTFEGIASAPSPDRLGDVVEPTGAQFKLPLPFLYQHDSARPIGHITSATVTDAGIVVRGEVARIDAPPTLKERLDVAWAEMKAKLIRGLSIGFKPIDYEPIKKGNGAVRFLKWEWLELSAVTIPAHQDATILLVRQFDSPPRAAPGQIARRGVALLTTSAGASAKLAAHPGAVLLNPRS